MTMWLLKNCSRCGGDIFIDRNSYGWFEQCLQCGYLYNMSNKTKVDRYGEAKKELARQRGDGTAAPSQGGARRHGSGGQETGHHTSLPTTV